MAIGGVTELADVLDYLAVGAVAVQVGTAIFADPTLPVRLIDELPPSAAGAASTPTRPLIGTALPRRLAVVREGRRIPAVGRRPAHPRPDGPHLGRVHQQM